MTDYTELKRLLDGCKESSCADASDFGRRISDLYDYLDPETVAEMVAENERLNAENKQLILLECYGGTAQAAINLLAERDQLKAENEELATAMSEILRVTPMGLEAFGIAALALGELGVNKEVQS